MDEEKKMNIPIQKTSYINPDFYRFISDEVLSRSDLNQEQFWNDFELLITDLSPINQQLLQTRNHLQSQIDNWHSHHQGMKFSQQDYVAFLEQIGYITEENEDFEIETDNVDPELASIAGPQLVVPLSNARFALNALNARWGSLYDALYGSDVIPKSDGLKACNKRNPARAKHVINYGRDFLDKTFPLDSGSHHDVASYVVYYHNLLAFFADGCSSGLKTPSQFVALCGHKSEPDAILLKNNGLHVELQVNRSGETGSQDMAGIDDIQVESALTCIMDFEDSVATVDANDKIALYRNWLQITQKSLEASFDKDGIHFIRQAENDRAYTSKDGEDYRLSGRALMMARNVGHLMDTELMQDFEGNHAPEGIVDAVVTALISTLDKHNSKTGSIYIVKPKMHGPDEVAFTCQLFSRVEDMLGLPRHTIKLGIMDEERRTTVNLKECIRQAKHRIVFINTGFLDRTGDEIHTSMMAGPFLPKAQIKKQPWIEAYENRNVNIGLACGFQGKAQIGKGMWAQPDEMLQMMQQKIVHPQAGANTAWVPSPTAATLHALHYHKVDVFKQQQELKQCPRISMDDLLMIPLLHDRESLTHIEIENELKNNIQGILGYVKRWIDEGIGCSKVADINNVYLMEDRATLRISSQHISNWLLHGIVKKDQVLNILKQMAAMVDLQNEHTAGYQTMMPDFENSLAFKAACELIFSGRDQPNGYTEPLLYEYRKLAKTRTIN